MMKIELFWQLLSGPIMHTAQVHPLVSHPKRPQPQQSTMGRLTRVTLGIETDT